MSTPIKKPVVAVVGHIDHGKTSLLDYIRKSRVAERESGGITQRISAYEIQHTTHEGEERLISFIDTPGHEAFQQMRRRGASAADIAILVVAADDGVKPQTLEAYNAIQDAKIPFIVAFTKVDKDTANLDRAKESVLKEGIYLEGLGGSVPHVAVSSKTGDGIPELLDMLILICDLEEITCDASAEPKAIVIESARDPRSGVSATVIVRSGTFETGNFAATPGSWAPLRVIENATGEKIQAITCGTPAKIVGFSKEPRVGSEILQVATKKEAEAIAHSEESTLKNEPVAQTESTHNIIRLVLKADTLGSLEALAYELEKIPRDTAELVVVGTSVGAINENDVKLLIGFSNAIIVGFNVKVDGSARDLAERQNITIETNEIIYKLTEWMEEAVKKIAPAQKEPEILGSAKIVKHFSTTGTKHVVGGSVQEGTIKRGNVVTIERRGIDVGKGKIVNIQTNKNDTESVSAGNEFGAQIETKADIVGGDIIKHISGQ
jgi:translation initiation factor IF-2